jgi:hypothetical protein
MDWYRSLEPGQVYYDTVEQEQFTVTLKKRSAWYVKRPHLKMLSRMFLDGDVVYIQWTQVARSHRPLHIENLVRRA